jgi:hypothetical protein
MAANRMHSTENSPKNISNSNSSTSERQCGSFLKSYVQAREYEEKSMTVIINISRVELKNVYTTNGGSKPNSTYAEKVTTNLTHYLTARNLGLNCKLLFQELC